MPSAPLPLGDSSSQPSSSAGLKVSYSNQKAIYHCTHGRTRPQWEEASARRQLSGSLRYNDAYRRLVELIQDFDFPASSDAIHVTPDGQHIGVSGVYKPRVKVFECSQLAQKFERAVDAQVVQFAFLDSSYRKMALLRQDRAIELHAQFGKHHVVRLPRFGRDLSYEPFRCDLFVAASGSDVYRFNLEQGRFLAPFVSTRHARSRAINGGAVGIGSNALSFNAMQCLLAVGRDDGVLECWDTRDRSSAAQLHLASTLRNSVGYQDAFTSSDIDACNQAHITSVAFHPHDGLTLAVGTSHGLVLLYDLRLTRPIQSKAHRYELPILHLEFAQQRTATVTNDSEKLIMSTDAKSIRVWSAVTGDAWTTIESPQADLHSSCLFPDSGLVMATGAEQRVQVWYVPQLGPAPAWCAFLDSMTEELEEKDQASLYEDYEFITRQQLSNFNAEHLIGTNLLRAYMHGFFMHAKLFTRLKQAYLDTLSADKIAAINSTMTTTKEKKAAERILQRRNGIVRVNQNFADALAANSKGAAKQPSSMNDKINSNPLQDNRFAAMFEEKEFAIDVNSEEYKRIHPRGMKSMKVTAVLKSSSDDDGDTDEENGNEDEEDAIEDANGMHDKDLLEVVRISDEIDMLESEDQIGSSTSTLSSTQRKRKLRELGVKTPTMFELREGRKWSDTLLPNASKDQHGVDNVSMPLKDRLAALNSQAVERSTNQSYGTQGQVKNRGLGRGNHQTNRGKIVGDNDHLEGDEPLPAFRRTMRGLLPKDHVENNDSFFSIRGRGRGGRGRGVMRGGRRR